MWKNAENHQVFPGTCSPPWDLRLSPCSAIGQYGLLLRSLTSLWLSTEPRLGVHSMPTKVLSARHLSWPLLDTPGLSQPFPLLPAWPGPTRQDSWSLSESERGPTGGPHSFTTVSVWVTMEPSSWEMSLPDGKRTLTDPRFQLSQGQMKTDIRTTLFLSSRTKCQVHLWRKRPGGLCCSNSSVSPTPRLLMRLFS